MSEAGLFLWVAVTFLKRDIEAKIKELKTDIDDYGAIYCHLGGGTTYEKSAFIEALQEIISAPNNPRYVIVRKNIFLNLVLQEDYHAVSEDLGRRKERAHFFQKQWNRFVGQSDLIYTRTIEGRKLLLKSRMHSLASQVDERVNRIKKWK